MQVRIKGRAQGRCATYRIIRGPKGKVSIRTYGRRAEGHPRAVGAGNGYVQTLQTADRVCQRNQTIDLSLPTISHIPNDALAERNIKHFVATVNIHG